MLVYYSANSRRDDFNLSLQILFVFDNHIYTGVGVLKKIDSDSSC